MKGVIFNILEEMVITECGMQSWNDILQQLELDGIYTSTESYPDTELFALVNAISEQTGIPTATLTGAYGEFLFTRLAERYPLFIDSQPTLRDFLKSVDSVIHIEVKKLFSNPSLPKFECEDLEDGRLLMRYHSARKLCTLAEGLIRGAAIKYATTIEIEHEVCYHKGNDHCDIIIRFIE